MQCGDAPAVVGGGDLHRRVLGEARTIGGEETSEDSNGGGGASPLMMGKSGRAGIWHVGP
jgi:hypothetical protein